MTAPNPAFEDGHDSLRVDIVAISATVRPPASEDRRIPLVVGITGHRDLREEDVDGLQKKVKGILLDFRKRYPATPLTVLSPLADGADRIAARAALELRGQYPDDVRLIVPLPMPRDIYLLDFDDHSLTEFLELLTVADYWFELRLLKGNTEANIRAPGAHRDGQYREVGKYIARHCQVLIALWNGRTTHKAGGTWEVVRFQTDGVEELGEFQSEDPGSENTQAPHRSRLEPAECGPVYQVVTPRAEAPDEVDGEPLSMRRHYPSTFPTELAAREYYAKIFQNIDGFNKDVTAPDDRLCAEIASSKNNILPRAFERDLPVGLHALLERYSVTDALAVRFARRMRKTQFRLHYIWALVGLLFFEFFAHLRESIAPVPFADVVLLAAAIALNVCGVVDYWVAKRRKYQDKYQDYRALAEGLRVQFFWRLAGLQDTVANYYLGNHRTELDWIRSALRNWNIPAAAFERVRRVDVVKEHWVRDQYRYFRKSTDENPHRTFATVTDACMLVAMAVAGGDLFYLLTFPNSHPHAVVVMAIALALIVAGLAQHYSEKMAFREHAKQYRRMRALFGRALQRIDRARDEEQIQGLIRDLGISALEENGDWVLLHRERPLEVPHAG